MEWLLLLILVGLNLTAWTVIGLTRRFSEGGSSAPGRQPPGRRVTPADVAVVIPAHNEEMVIAAALESVLARLPPENVHVVADGCSDATAEIARSYGVWVLELEPGRGKAGGIEAAVHHFRLPRRFEVLLILDADTELQDGYLEHGLPLFRDPRVAALAGYARTRWRPAELSLIGRILVSYRTRVYAVMQWLKYAQTWRYTNVTAIIPGFASMYRTRALPAMQLNPGGLIIEDFNMTFELHRHRLGRIAFSPMISALTQDPDNLGDYARQVWRWHLGFWQTLRRHGFWWSGFSAALGFFVAEVVVASIAIIMVVAMLLFVGVVALTGDLVEPWPSLASAHATLASIATPQRVLLFLVLPDYLLTCIAALTMRRPSLLLYGLAFLPIRVLDSIITMRALLTAWRSDSSGQWTSPRRRATPALRPAQVTEDE